MGRLINPDAMPPPESPPQQPVAPPPPFPNSVNQLAFLNQTATKLGFNVTYPAQAMGPPHLPTWTVQCLSALSFYIFSSWFPKFPTVNGVEKGRGVGKNQKIAKEEAARQALHAMGWAPGS
jgi:hypothetical protein